MTTAQAIQIRNIGSYLEVLKPKASLLLTYIGVCSAIVAGAGNVSPELLLIAGVIFIASAGANGLTNYLDCGVDALMQRTKHRALPSRRIEPPEKVLPLTISLSVAGLALAWYLHPLAFLADLVGTLAAVIWRKRATCVFPQGMIASCAPVLMGWFTINQDAGWDLLLLCLLIGMWLPLHVWSVMIAHRQDYINAGLTYFPMDREVRDSVRVLLVFAGGLFIASLALYFAGDFSWLYLALSGALGALMLYATARLVITKASAQAWRLYKLSSFPYLGVVFLAMCLDLWLLR